MKYITEIDIDRYYFTNDLLELSGVCYKTFLIKLKQGRIKATKPIGDKVWRIKGMDFIKWYQGDKLGINRKT